MEKYVFSSEERALYEGMEIPFAIYEFLDSRVVTAVLSAGFMRLFGYTDKAQAYYDMDHDMYRDTHPDDRSRIASAAVHFATEDGVYDAVYRTRDHETGGYRIIHAIGRHVVNSDGVRLAYVSYTDEGEYSQNGEGDELSRALSHRIREENAPRGATYDKLTGLPVMSYFFRLAHFSKAKIIAKGSQPALIFLDLNGMKFFNQKYTFTEGNNLLRSLGELLSKYFGAENSCHMGADHFAAIAEEKHLGIILSDFVSDCDKLNGGINLPVRIGIYQNSMEDVPLETAFDRAKLACDTLRKSISSAYFIYDTALKKRADMRQYVLENIDTALAEKWIKVYYQPIVRAVNGRVCDEEALARWIDPERGIMPPCDFIPYLEESGQIYKLDLYVLDEVLEKLRIQKENGLYLVPQSINLSRSDFDICDMVAEICKRVDASGIEREKITIELTESVVGSDFEFIKVQVERFRDAGFHVWMDDFGSGYSSLDMLQSLKFDLLKFDMSFMKKLDEGTSGKIILTELMRMATALGVDTVCEGVETLDQVHFLQDIGCSKLQGYYYTKPIPLDSILDRYKRGIQIGFENPEESGYYETIGKANLYDLNVITNDSGAAIQNFFNSIPMSIIELGGGVVSFARSNHTFRQFMLRFYGFDFGGGEKALNDHPVGAGSRFMDNVRQCCESSTAMFFDDELPDGSVSHTFARKIGSNPVTGTNAIAVAVLSISKPDSGATYAEIARALASDYYNIYCVDLDTERFIEYSSPVGGEEIALERHGENFFDECVKASARIYEEDRDRFFTVFSRENIIRALDTKGVFTTSYRLTDRGEPMRVNMKVTRMQPNGRRIIMGISIENA